MAEWGLVEPTHRKIVCPALDKGDALYFHVIMYKSLSWNSIITQNNRAQVHYPPHTCFFLCYFYLTAAIYCSWGQRPSPSIDGWGMRNDLDDYDGQIVSGDKCGLNFPTFILQLREKTSTRKLTNWDLNRPAGWEVTSYPLTTAVVPILVDYVFTIVIYYEPIVSPPCRVHPFRDLIHVAWTFYN